MKVSILLGSIREERQSHRLAYYLEGQIAKKGVISHLIDLKNYSLPLFGSVISNEERKGVNEISAILKGSEAVVIVTPEYMSNISAVTQNVLEYCGKELIGKVTAIATASATRFGGLNASGNLQIALLNLGTYPSPKRLLVPESNSAFDRDGEPANDEIKNRAAQFICELLSYTELLKNKNP